MIRIMKRMPVIVLLTALFAAAAHAQAPVPDSALEKPPKASLRPVPAAPQVGAASYILSDFNSGRVIV